jgi:hypothetical protein
LKENHQEGKVMTVRQIFAVAIWLAPVLVAGCGQAASNATDRPVVAVKAVNSSAAEEATSGNTEADESQPVEQTAAPKPLPSDLAKPKPPPADRAPVRPGDAEKITFDDLNLGMQADIVFRDFMVSDRVKDLDGKRISIVGYMHGGQAAQRGIKEFVLLKNTQCKFGPGGQADHLANVILRADTSTGFTPSPIKVEGTLKLEPFQGPDGNTWSIYQLEDAQIR